MRRAIGEYLRIDIAPHSVSVQRASRWRWPGRAATPAGVLAAQAIAPASGHSFDAIANALRALLGELDAGGWPVSFIVADELTRMWRVTPPPGAARMADLEAAASLRFQSLYGESPSAWQLAADWSTIQPFFAAAVPRALLAVLSAVAQDSRLAIVAIEPRFVHAWNCGRRSLQPGAWFGHVHDQLLTLGATAAGGIGLCAIRALPIPPGADHAWLTQTLQREALLLDMQAPALLQVSGAAPAAWTQAVSNAAQIPCAPLGKSA